jgi:Probable sensor domain DACNV
LLIKEKFQMPEKCSHLAFEHDALHKYHLDLADYIRQCWSYDESEVESAMAPAGDFPANPYFENLLSVCYQASMLREEEHQVRLRLILASPGRFSAEEFPPMGLHRQIFTRPRACTEFELRKLSPAAAFARTLVGVELNQQNQWQIWGLVHSGKRWLQSYQGGRQMPPEIPPVPVIHLAGPGRLAVLRGMNTLADLVGGRIITPDLNVFEAKWLQDYFLPARMELMSLVHSSAAGPRSLSTLIDPTIMRIIGRHVMMRVITTMRNIHRGGTFLYLPDDRSEEFTAPNPLITIKYQFHKRGVQPRLLDLMNQTLQSLITDYGEELKEGMLLSWQDYISINSNSLSLLDEAIFEVAHQLADFAGVDGAVVLTNKSRVLGFGAMIKGDFDQVPTVGRAVDVEGEKRRQEVTESLGTRHRSVFYLCHQVPDAMGIVISQDGSARLIKWKDGLVTYWEQAISIPLKMA